MTAAIEASRNNHSTGALRYSSLSLSSTTANVVHDIAVGIMRVLWYKPPVGITAVVTAVRWIRRRQQKQQRRRQLLEEKVTEEGERREMANSGHRATRLDRADARMHRLHDCCVHRVRARLCHDALFRHSSKQPWHDHVLQVLRSSLHDEPTMSLQHRVQHLDNAVACRYDDHDAADNDDEVAWQYAFHTAHLVVLDELTRVLRVQLVQVAARLARQVEIVQARLDRRSRQKTWPYYRLMHVLLPSRLVQYCGTDDESCRYQMLQSLYERESQRIGQLTRALQYNVDDFPSQLLVEAVQRSVQLGQPDAVSSTHFNSAALSAANDWNSFSKAIHHIVLQLSRSVAQTANTLSTRSRSLGFRANIDASIAREILDKAMSEESPWPNATTSMHVVLEQLIQDLQRNVDSRPSTPESGDGKATVLLQLIAALSTRKRIGETDKGWHLHAMIETMRRWDWYELPSSLAIIACSFRIHSWMRPYWPRARSNIGYAYNKSLEIFNERVWIPLRGIFDDIMNKHPGMFSAFGLATEEESLDSMLQTMGFGDGTAATREQALQQATRAYEHDMQSSLLWHAARGQLPRLLLIQVQQLKVGMLSALDTIDVLMKGNRIHLQILALIPGVLMLTFGTRAAIRSLYNVRTRDWRSLSAVHEEMKAHLEKVQMLLIRHGSDQELKQSMADGVIGEVLVAIYRYLILLDFCRPPIPATVCDQVQSVLQDLVSDLLCLSTSRLLDCVTMILQRHAELKRYLS